MDVLGDRLEQMLNRIVEARRKSEWLPNGYRGRVGKEKPSSKRGLNGCGDRI
jgi:hypothetical protein